MKAGVRSEDFLAVLLCACEILMNPSPGRILRFLGGGGPQGVGPRLYSLERAKWIERRGSGKTAAFRITEAGRLAVSGGVDPARRWRRSWDGLWRMLLFDLPASEHAMRVTLWRWLLGERFGYLQNSAWITPDPMDDSMLPLKGGGFRADSLLILLARPGPNQAQESIVNAAWDFPEINARYQSHLEVLAAGEELLVTGVGEPKQLRRWLARERLSWLEAVAADPLLPGALLPSGYLGQIAWQKRQEVLSALARKAELSSQNV